MRRRQLPLLLATLGLAACGSSVEGTLSIDGQPAVLDRCESAAPRGFDGVDLITDDERYVRLLRDTRGEDIVSVIFFDAGRDSGPILGDCAMGTIESTGTRINDVTALDGEAVIDCDHSYTDQNMEQQRVTVVGDVTFSNCH